MAIGDAAAAAGYDIVPGTTPANTIDTEINKTRDYVATKTPPDASTTVKGVVYLAPVPYVSSNPYQAVTPAGVTNAHHTKAEIDARIGHDATGNTLRSPNGAANIRADDSGVIFSGNIYSTSVSGSGSYRGVSVNQNGAIGYVPSLQALKQLAGVQDTDIAAWLALDLRRFFYKGDETELERLGWFAEDVEAIEPGITFTDENGDLAGIDYAAAVVPLLAVIQSLAARIEQLEERMPDE